MPTSYPKDNAKDNNAGNWQDESKANSSLPFRGSNMRPVHGRSQHGLDGAALPPRRSPLTANTALEAVTIPSDNPGAFDPHGDGRGGIAGLRDRYDRPRRSQLIGAQSRLRQDKSTGALKEVAGRYRVLFGGHHVVHKGLRRSIADAYAAYVGQVVNLPEDTYGLALRALDHTFNTGRQPPGAIDLNLHASPYATSPAKHAQIFNTAHRIMRDLGAYEYDVSYYCPGELDQLRGMRRAEASRQEEGYRSAPRFQPGEPGPQREAVAVSRRPSRRTPGELAGDPSVNPVTGAVRPPGFDPATLAQPQPERPRLSRLQTAPSRETDSRGAPGAASRAAAARPSTAAAAARSVAAALDTADAAEAREQGGGGGPEEVDGLEQRQRRGLRRLSSPGMFTKTPAHYRISKYYEHVSPTEEVVQMIMRKKALYEAKRQMAGAGEDSSEPAADGNADAVAGAPAARRAVQQRRPAGPAAPPSRQDAESASNISAAVSTGADPGAAAGHDEDDPTLRVMRQVLAVGTRRSGGTAAAAAAAAGGRSRAQSPGRASAPSAPPPHTRPEVGPQVDAVPPYGDNTTERILWIIETAYELGLEEVLGLEGPPIDPRSRRLWPLPHRRDFYDGVYSSPERYRPYTDVQEGYSSPGSPDHFASPPGRADSPPYARYGFNGGYLGYRGYGEYGGYYRYDEETGRHVDEAAARRYVRQVLPESEAKMYGRSRRLRPA